MHSENAFVKISAHICAIWENKTTRTHLSTCDFARQVFNIILQKKCIDSLWEIKAILMHMHIWWKSNYLRPCFTSALSVRHIYASYTSCFVCTDSRRHTLHTWALFSPEPALNIFQAALQFISLRAVGGISHPYRPQQAGCEKRRAFASVWWCRRGWLNRMPPEAVWYRIRLAFSYLVKCARLFDTDITLLQSPGPLQGRTGSHPQDKWFHEP